MDNGSCRVLCEFWRIVLGSVTFDMKGAVGLPLCAVVCTVSLSLPKCIYISVNKIKTSTEWFINSLKSRGFSPGFSCFA